MKIIIICIYKTYQYKIQDGQVNSNTIIGGIIGYYCNNISKSYNYININNISSDILNMYPSPTKFKAFVGDWKNRYN